jgi:hypothetical protein
MIDVDTAHRPVDRRTVCVRGRSWIDAQGHESWRATAELDELRPGSPYLPPQLGGELASTEQNSFRLQQRL